MYGDIIYQSPELGVLKNLKHDSAVDVLVTQVWLLFECTMMSKGRETPHKGQRELM